jgi:acetyl esterase
MPPTLVVSAELDTLRDEGEPYAELLKRAGVKAQWIRFGDAPHGFTQYYGQPGVSPAGRISLDAGATALRAALAAP